MATLTTRVVDTNINGKAENFDKMIHLLAQDRTALYSNVPHISVNQDLYQWQEQDFRAVRPVNAHIDGADAPAATAQNPDLKSNRCQIFLSTIDVGDRARAIRKYGRGDELAYQLQLEMETLFLGIEHALVGGDQAAVAAVGNTPARLASFQNQVSDATTNTNNANRAFSEALLLGVIKDVWDEGGKSPMIHVTSSHAIKVADLARNVPGGANVQRDFASSTTVTNAVTMYRSPFGMHTFVLNPRLNANNMLFVDPEHTCVGIRQPMRSERLAKTGYRERTMISTDLTLVVKNSRANGYLGDLLTGRESA